MVVTSRPGADEPALVTRSDFDVAQRAGWICAWISRRRGRFSCAVIPQGAMPHLIPPEKPGPMDSGRIGGEGKGVGAQLDPRGRRRRSGLCYCAPVRVVPRGR